MVAWSRRIFVSRESAVKVAIIKWTRSVLCSKAGKDEKLGPMSQAPEILVYVFAVYSGIPAAKLSVLVRLIKRERFRPVHFEEFRRNLERFMREKYCFG